MVQLQSEPITQLQRIYRSILQRLAKGPVMLLQRSSMAAIMVSPEQWNAMTSELERLRRVVQSDKDFADMRAGQYVTELPE